MAREALGTTPTSPVLDVACGSGRLLLPLAKDGYRVVGVDRSAPMLAKAQKRLRRNKSAQSRTSLLLADMRDFAFKPRFGFAVCAFHSLQHIVETKELKQVFSNIFNSLKPMGRFAFDVLAPNPDWLNRDPNKRWGRTSFRHPSTGQRIEYSTNHRFDSQRRVVHMNIFYRALEPPVKQGAKAPSSPTDVPPFQDLILEENEERIVRLSHRQFELSEIETLVRSAGLRFRETFGSFQGESFDEYSDELIVVVERPA